MPRRVCAIARIFAGMSTEVPVVHRQATPHRGARCGGSPFGRERPGEQLRARYRTPAFLNLGATLTYRDLEWLSRLRQVFAIWAGWRALLDQLNDRPVGQLSEVPARSCVCSRAACSPAPGTHPVNSDQTQNNATETASAMPTARLVDSPVVCPPDCPVTPSL